jgi:DNA-binding PadR family transcriptional regulator
MSDAVTREFLLAFWKIHILYHAEEHGVYGHWMLEELHRHGYRLSPGTLYPILARMVRHGWIRAAEPARSREARVYRITPAGSDVLKRLRGSLAELQHEVTPKVSRKKKRTPSRIMPSYMTSARPRRSTRADIGRRRT